MCENRENLLTGLEQDALGPWLSDTPTIEALVSLPDSLPAIAGARYVTSGHRGHADAYAAACLGDGIAPLEAQLILVASDLSPIGLLPSITCRAPLGRPR
jgi:hypothetical protein